MRDPLGLVGFARILKTQANFGEAGDGVRNLRILAPSPGSHSFGFALGLLWLCLVVFGIALDRLGFALVRVGAALGLAVFAHILHPWSTMFWGQAVRASKVIWVTGACFYRLRTTRPPPDEYFISPLRTARRCCKDYYLATLRTARQKASDF